MKKNSFVIFISGYFLLVGALFLAFPIIKNNFRSVRVAAIVNGVEVYRGVLSSVEVESAGARTKLTIYKHPLNVTIVSQYVSDNITVLPVITNEQ